MEWDWSLESCSVVQGDHDQAAEVQRLRGCEDLAIGGLQLTVSALSNGEDLATGFGDLG